MIAILQILVTLVLTIVYGVFLIDFNGLIDVLKVVAFYLTINIIYILLIILIFVLIVLLTEKLRKDALWKHQLLMAFSKYFFCSLLRVKLIVKGKENLPKNNRFVLYSNHIEYNDPLYIKQIYNHTNLSYVSKIPLFKYPIVKNVLRGIGCIPIGKLADRKSLEAILETIKVVKSGQPMGIFPEGKRSYSNNLGSFKPGAFKVAQKAKADISLVVLYDFHEINRKIYRIKKVKVYLTILPLIKYEDIKDLDTIVISNMAYQLIDEELDKYKNKFDSK
ncbi:MAG: lysophospholipid acyltransferase family protein [Tenericutes bacterium]|jgi:1-acyl-sn-glycerol-3-phosphate acyltransferase|nr:lysophospholipid acyltransferase family protein [Mycoplasmatota bacterium]